MMLNYQKGKIMKITLLTTAILLLACSFICNAVNFDILNNTPNAVQIAYAGQDLAHSFGLKNGGDPSWKMQVTLNSGEFCHMYYENDGVSNNCSSILGIDVSNEDVTHHIEFNFDNHSSKNSINLLMSAGNGAHTMRIYDNTSSGNIYASLIQAGSFLSGYDYRGFIIIDLL